MLNALGLERDIDLVGLSYGGWIAANYALGSPERLRKAVLIAPAGTISPLPFSWIWRAVLCALPHPWFTRNFMGWVLEDLVAREGDGFLDQVTEVAYATLRSFEPRPMANPEVMTNADLGGFSVPVLFVVGENEKLYPASEAVERLHDVAPQIQTRIVEGAGHDVTMVRAVEVNWIILDFLAE